ncbi:MAG: hypothetical protein AB4062_04240 [Crocosphaera sp.]
MKIKFPKWIRFSCLLCLSSLVIILNNHYALKANESNSEVESCLPSVDNQHVFERQLLGVVNYEDRQYYLFSLVVNQGVAFFDDWNYKKDSYTIVSLGRFGCAIHMATGQYHQSSLEKYVPQYVARQLALIKLKYELNQAGSLTNFLQPPDVLEEHGSPWILFPEDVWAWQQLGISLPDNHRVIRDVSELGL